jgi:hypothetical protein
VDSHIVSWYRRYPSARAILCPIRAIQFEGTLYQTTVHCCSFLPRVTAYGAVAFLPHLEGQLPRRQNRQAIDVDPPQKAYTNGCTANAIDDSFPFVFGSVERRIAKRARPSRLS